MLQGDEILRDQHPLKTGPDDQERQSLDEFHPSPTGHTAPYRDRIKHAEVKC
jgi:hypothetical protein